MRIDVLVYYNTNIIYKHLIHTDQGCHGNEF